MKKSGALVDGKDVVLDPLEDRARPQHDGSRRHGATHASPEAPSSRPSKRAAWDQIPPPSARARDEKQDMRAPAQLNRRQTK
jgi:hypothetical protein